MLKILIEELHDKFYQHLDHLEDFKKFLEVNRFVTDSKAPTLPRNSISNRLYFVRDHY